MQHALAHHSVLLVTMPLMFIMSIVFYALAQPHRREVKDPEGQRLLPPHRPIWYVYDFSSYTRLGRKYLLVALVIQLACLAQGGALLLVALK